MLARPDNYDFCWPRQQAIQRAEQRRRTVRVLGHDGSEHPEDPASPLIIPLLTGEREEPQQHRRRDSIPGWDGPVAAGLHPLDQSFMVMAGEKTSAIGFVPKM